jgi:hypothetical protein
MKITALTKYQRAKVRSNLREIFNSATEADIFGGRTWYDGAHKICLDYAVEFGTTTERVAQILSALSPNNKWERNIKDTRIVLEAVRSGAAPESVKVCTFHSNKYKAFAIARGELSILANSPKTFAFVRNIGALDETKVTIDLWHLRACYGVTVEGGLTLKRYRELERLTIDEAKKVGLKGYEFQAIVWEALRNSGKF